MASARSSTPPLGIDPETGEVTEAARSGAADDDNTRRSQRRSRSTLRRYCVHNGLTHMPTLTFATPAIDVRQLTEAVRHFRRRILRASWGPSEPFPYVWVPERGHQATERLHVHMGVSWWDEYECVEVCEKCARPNLRKKRSDIPPAGSNCWGCLWGHGFVGAPSEGTDNPKALASYVSKYVSKDWDEREMGAQRYRVAEGFQPEPVRIVASTYADAVREASVAMKGRPVSVTPLHEDVAGWDGPPVWTMEWS